MTGLRRVAVTNDDLTRLIEFSKEFDFYDGDDTMRLYFEHSDPAGWEIIVDEANNLVAYAATNILGNGDVGFGYQIVISKAHRGSNVAKLFKCRPGQKHELAKLSPCSGGYGGWALQSSLVALLAKDRDIAISEKFIEYHGPVSKECLESTIGSFRQPNGVKCVYSLNPQDSCKIDDYAKAITPLDRRKFWQAYGYDQNAVTVVAEKNGEIIGFGMLRQETPIDSYVLMPLYANSDEIAEAIAMELLKWLNKRLKLGETVGVDFPLLARHRWGFGLASQLRLQPIYAMMLWHQPRMTKLVWATDFSKIHIGHYFWPM